MGGCSARSRDPFEPLRVRGISQAVWEARGYAPYYGTAHPSHNAEAVRAELKVYDLTPQQRGFYTRYTNAARDAPPPKRVRAAHDGHEGMGDGLLIHKHAVPGAEAVLPQLRPRFPVETDKRGHWHSHESAFRLNPDDLEHHIEADHDDGDVGLSERHRHDALAKYLLPPAPKETYVHDHATDPAFDGEFGHRRRAQHMRSKHAHDHPAGKTARGPHSHRRQARGQRVAGRLDIHPWALERLNAARRVYFVLEGALKADAVLSRIVQVNEPASVFDVPSVTLWRAPELREFALRHLSRKLVVVVPDADWRENDRVVAQALLCREFLRELGLAVCVAAPPAEPNQEQCNCDGSVRLSDEGQACARCGGYLKGVDDFLAAGGQTDNLQVLDRQASLLPPALYADQDGQFKRKSIRTLARFLGVRRDAEAVVGYLKTRIEWGHVTADRALELEQSPWTGRPTEWKGRAADWPTITISPGLRYQERVGRLGDFRYQERQSPQEDIAILTDVIDGESWDDAAAPWGKTGATARRRLRHAKWATAMRHILVEVSILEAAAADYTPSEIAAAFEISPSMVRRVIRAGGVNPGWLEELNPRARAELQTAIEAIKSGHRGGIDSSPASGA